MLEYQSIDRRDELSYDEFVAHYAVPGKPVVLTDLMQDWEATQCWSFEFFKRYHGNVMITARCSDDYGQTVALPLAEYIDHLADPNAHYYLKDWVFENDIPGLCTQYRISRHFKNWAMHLPRMLRPRWRWLFIGPASSASHLHVDFLLTSAWNALFAGKKRWLAYAPEQSKYMYRGAVDAFRPDFARFPLFAQAQAHTHLQSPGEIMFMPATWWHAVRNEEPTLALSENFINAINARNYLRPHVMIRFLRYADQPFAIS